MTKDDNDLRNLIEKTRDKYDSIGRVYCPILHAYVHFGAEGKTHLLYKSNRKKRPVKEQKYKMNLFYLVVPVLKNAESIQAWRFTQQEESDVQYYAIHHAVGKHPIDIRVIIKRTNDGQLNYHSVMENKKRSHNK